MITQKGLCEICSPKQWKTISSDMLLDLGYPVYGANGIIGYYSEFNHTKKTLLITCRGATCGNLNICEPYSYINGNAMALDELSEDINIQYLYYYLQNRGFTDVITGSAQPQIVRQSLKKVQVIYPEIERQREIVTSLDKLTALISLRKQQLAKLDELVKTRFVEMFGDPEANSKGWPIDNMCNLCSVGSSKRIYQSEQSSAGVAFLRISDLTNLINTGVITESLYIPEKRYAELQAQSQVPVQGDILVTSRGTLGQCYIVKADDRFYFQDGMISWLSEYGDNITPIYISYLFSMPGFRKQIDSMQAGSTVAYLSIAMIKKLKVMVPDLEIQQQFAAFVAQADKSKLTIRQSLNKLEVLKKSLMQEYFG